MISPSRPGNGNIIIPAAMMANCHTTSSKQLYIIVPN